MSESLIANAKANVMDGSRAQLVLAVRKNSAAEDPSGWHWLFERTWPPQNDQALREGGVVGVVEGLAPRERRLPPPECLKSEWGYIVCEK